MPDGWEAARGLNPGLDDAAVDADGDWLTNRQEYLRGTCPAMPLSRTAFFYADAERGPPAVRVLPRRAARGRRPKATVQQAVDVAVSGDT